MPDANSLPSVPLPAIPSAAQLDSAIALAPAPIRPLATRTLGWLRAHLYPVEDTSEERSISAGRSPSSESSDDMPLSKSDMLKRQIPVMTVPYVKGEDEFEDVRPMMPPRRVTDLVAQQSRKDRGRRMSHLVIDNQRGRLSELKKDYKMERIFVPDVGSNTNSNSHESSQQRRRRQRADQSESQPEQRRHPRRAGGSEPTPLVTNLMSGSTQPNYQPTTFSTMSVSNPPNKSSSSASKFKDYRDRLRDDITGSVMMGRSDADWDITGSQYIIPPKIRISPDNQWKVEKGLKEALASEAFKIWPTYEDDRESKYSIRSRRNVEGRAKEQLEESGLFEQTQGNEARKRKEELLRQWKEKDERKMEERRRVHGGWESVMENKALINLDGFAPTLRNVPNRIKTPTDAELEAMENEERAKKLRDKETMRGDDKRSSSSGSSYRQLSPSSVSSTELYNQTSEQARKNTNPRPNNATKIAQILLITSPKLSSYRFSAYPSSA